MSDEKKYIPFLRSYRDAGKELPEEERLKFYEAIIDYGLDGKEPVFDNPALRIVWKLVQPVLDTSRQRSEAGKRGGINGAGVSRNAGNQNAKKNNSKSIGNNSKSIPNQKQINSKTIAKQKQNNTGEGEGEGEGNGEGDKKETDKEKVLTKRDKARAFWKSVNSIYPRHRRVYEASERALRHVEERKLWERQDEILKTTEEWKASEDWQREGGKFIPALSRYIEEGRYEAKPESDTPLFTTKPRLQTENYDKSIADLVQRGVMKPPPSFNNPQNNHDQDNER